MTFKAHRQGDLRSCGATTIVTGQNFVKVNGQLWAVEGDQNTHGGGALIAGGGRRVKINGKKTIAIGDHASPDSLCGTAGGAHCDPIAVGGDSITQVDS